MAQYGRMILNSVAAAAILFFAALAGVTLFLAVTHYAFYLDAMLYYNIVWFVAALLAFYCALMVVPNSLAIFTGLCAGLSFIIVCLWDASLALRYPVPTRLVEMLPGWLFILTWGTITIAAFRSPNPAVKLTGWAWLAVFCLLTGLWGGHIAGTWTVVQNRNHFIRQADQQVLQVAEHLGGYFDAHGAYPPSLNEAGIAETLTTLPETGKRIKYFRHTDSFALTFEDPLPSENTTFCYDTARGGWQPEDPLDTLGRGPGHMFLGFLRK